MCRVFDPWHSFAALMLSLRDIFSKLACRSPLTWTCTQSALLLTYYKHLLNVRVNFPHSLFWSLHLAYRNYVAGCFAVSKASASSVLSHLKWCISIIKGRVWGRFHSPVFCNNDQSIWTWEKKSITSLARSKVLRKRNVLSTCALWCHTSPRSATTMPHKVLATPSETAMFLSHPKHVEGTTKHQLWQDTEGQMHKAIALLLRQNFRTNSTKKRTQSRRKGASSYSAWPDSFEYI